MDFSQYIHYNYEDLLNDDAFLHFIIDQKASDLDAWENFKKEQPYRSKVAQAAFETLSAYRQQKVFTNEAHNRWFLIELRQPLILLNPK